MTSELRVNRIIPVDGVPSGGGGGIVQVRHATQSSQITNTATSYVDLISCQITPIEFNTSKILVIIDQPYHMSRSSSKCSGGFKVLRGSTEIATPNGTGASGGTGPYACSYEGTGTSYFSIIDRWSFTILDEPASTSALVYKVQMACASSNNSGRIRAQYSGTSGDQKGHISLLEISA